MERITLPILLKLDSFVTDRGLDMQKRYSRSLVCTVLLSCPSATMIYHFSFTRRPCSWPLQRGWTKYSPPMVSLLLYCRPQNPDLHLQPFSEHSNLSKGGSGNHLCGWILAIPLGYELSLSRGVHSIDQSLTPTTTSKPVRRILASPVWRWLVQWNLYGPCREMPERFNLCRCILGKNDTKRAYGMLADVSYLIALH
jgi:hypothetical protein